MLEILGYAFVFWLSYRLLISYIELKQLEKNVGAAVELMEEHSRNIIVVFERVTHNDEDVILCYDTENNFIAQGSSKEEVVKIAQKRFPTKNIATYKREELQWINNQSEKNSQDGSSNL